MGLGNDTSSVVKDTKDVASIKQKKRSLNGHKLQLGNHIRDCRSRIAHYKAVKSTEAKEMINQAFLKIIEQQAKCGEIFGELHVLDGAEEVSYNKQEEDLNKQIDELAGLIEAAGQEMEQASLTAGDQYQPRAAGPPPIRKLDVKLTEFRTDAADQWFEETERALGVAGVVEDREKIVVIQKYIPENIREAKRSLFNGGSYQTVKDAVIKAVEKTEEEKFKAFLAMQLGDRKPSEAWADLTKLMPTNAQDFQDLVMKQKFLAMVGTDLRQHLTEDTLTLAGGLHTEQIERYVQKVDKLFGSKKPKATVNSVKKEADSKEAGVSEVRNGRDSGKSQQKGNGRRKDSRSSSRKRDNGWSEQMCRIHRRFGNKAWSCDKPDACPLAKLIAKKPEKK